MKNTAHGKPLFISEGNSQLLNEINPLNEREIQDLIFKYPECLPISDIDESYNPVIPVCIELYTNAGPLDILMISPNGDIVLIETKLWNNPEARRKVVAQILDYAKEMAKWSYSDLQREINRKLNTKGNILFDIASKYSSNLTLNEVDFVDAVSRNLRLGKFLLLIAGDGIREGAKNLVEFINKSGSLNFNLAMVEIPVYKTDKDELILFPRTIVKTVEIQKINIEMPEGFRLISNDPQNNETTNNIGGISDELKKRRKFYYKIWSEFISQLEFDDPEQSVPNITRTSNLYFYPGKDKYSWISCYFMNSANKVGVYFRFHADPRGYSQKVQLEQYKNNIKEELGDEVSWEWDNNSTDAFSISLRLDDVYSKKNRQKVFDFFNHWSNKFVNVIRPRLKEID